MTGDPGPGVPEALPRVLRMLDERLGVETVDSIWIFPPLKRGRREWGLVAASCFIEAAGPGPAAPKRLLFTAPYAGERTGRTLRLDVSFREQGEGPPDCFPRVMDGVVRRSSDDLGESREVRVGGDRTRFERLMVEFDPGLFEEVAEPFQATIP